MKFGLGMGFACLRALQVVMGRLQLPHKAPAKSNCLSLEYQGLKALKIPKRSSKPELGGRINSPPLLFAGDFKSLIC